MATLLDYAVDTMFDEGWGYTSGSIMTGAQTISFVRDLYPGKSRPRMYSFKAGAAAVANDVEIKLGLINFADWSDAASAVATGSIVLRKGDVLNFGTEAAPNPVVIDADTAIPAVTTLAATVTVPVLPLLDAIAANDEAYSYALVPVQFVETGGAFDNSSDIATAQNKSVGYWSLKAVTGRNATLTLSGSMITNDPSVYIFNKLNNGGRYAYYEIRYHPYCTFKFLADDGTTTTYQYGKGPQAKVATCTSNFKATMDKTDIIKVEATLEACGRPIDYVILSTDSAEVTAFTWTNADLT